MSTIGVYFSRYINVNNNRAFVQIMLILVLVLTGAVAFSSIFGAGSGATYMDEVDCSGDESRLIDCSRSLFVSCSSSRRGAGVRCQGTHMVVIR